MAINNRLKNQHLLWRAGFGPMVENVSDLDNISQKELWSKLLNQSQKKPIKIDVAQNLVDLYKEIFTGMQGANTNNNMQGVVVLKKGEITKDQQKQIRLLSVEDLKKLNILWLEEMINSEAQLREKMSLFWHGHFATRIENSYFQQELLQTIRENALGNFKDLLKSVSKSASMLQFLNNQQNRKKKPNENFAREVMELFTLGRGNYTETDVKEAARAFTGWGFNLKGEFEFRKFVHDDDSKTFLGKVGNFNGDDILDILLQQKQTAKFITKKIYKFFVNEKIDDEKTDWLSNRFYKNDYDITKLLTDIFTSDWFYNEKNVGTQIKSPVQLIAGIRRMMPLQLENDQAQLLFQRALGQILFYPPNVAGWPGGKSWIDSSSLMLRLRLPQILAANDLMDIKSKTDDDVMMGMMMEAQIKRIKTAVKGATATIDWEPILKIFDPIVKEKLYQKISDTILQTKNKITENVLQKFLNNDSRQNFTKSTIINLMATPEYQLC